jgi:DNA-binding LacI/PurR family transcriptional regulator
LSKLPAHPTVATIRLVAQEAGVSRATVSRAFSQPDLLTALTVDKVLRAADRLGYVPNQVARALSTGRMGNIALILPDVTNPFFSTLMRGAQSAAREKGYATFLGDSDETDDLENLLLSRLAAQVDGFILASPRLAEELIRRHAARRPLVIVNRDLDDISRVLVDTTGGFARAVDHLADLGHRRIAYVGAPPSSWSNGERLRVVEARAAERGLGFCHVDAQRPSHAAGRASVGRILESGATAALAVDDVVAQGMIGGLADRGLSVPSDFSLVGCDDVIAETTHPPLTTVTAHCARAGAAAVEMLLDAQARASATPSRLVLTGELIVRGSTGPAPHVSPLHIRFHSSPGRTLP